MRTSVILADIFLAAGLLLGAGSLASAQEQQVSLYTTREPGLIKPLLEAFTKASGVKVNAIFFKDGMAERVAAEGQRSPADVLMTVDIGNLIDLLDRNVTQPIKSDVLEAAVPANLRGADGSWFTLATRARVVYAAKNLPVDALNYENLADPRWKGKICIRSGQHPYNTALTAAYIAHHGAAKAEAWLRGVKANLARKPGGGDREVARDILGGLCEIGVGNSYYVGIMRSGQGGPEQKTWGDAHQGHPADLRRRRHAGEHLRRLGGEIRPQQGERHQAAGISGLRRGAEALRQSRFRISREGGRPHGPDHPVSRDS